MSYQEAAKSPQPSGEDKTEQLSSPVVDEVLSEPLDDADLEEVVGGDGGPDDSPQQEIIIFRKPVWEGALPTGIMKYRLAICRLRLELWELLYDSSLCNFIHQWFHKL